MNLSVIGINKCVAICYTNLIINPDEANKVLCISEKLSLIFISKPQPYLSYLCTVSNYFCYYRNVVLTWTLLVHNLNYCFHILYVCIHIGNVIGFGIYILTLLAI